MLALPPRVPDFVHACTKDELLRALHRINSEHLAGLKAVFLLGGTRNQQRCWNSSLGCYGLYWNGCVFLCAHPFNLGGHTLDSMRDFYLGDVLQHEIAHHVDRLRRASDKTKEGFANAFVQQQRG